MNLDWIEKDFFIFDKKDLEFSYMEGSWNGWQGVKVTHIPTQLSVTADIPIKKLNCKHPWAQLLQMLDNVIRWHNRTIQYWREKNGE